MRCAPAMTTPTGPSATGTTNSLGRSTTTWRPVAGSASRSPNSTAVADGAPPDPAPSPAPLGTLPPLPRLSELSTDLAASVEALTRLHPRFATGAVPSLYLHFAHWPALPGLVEGHLAPFAESGRLADRVEAIAVSVQAEARALAGKIAVTSPPEGTEAALRRFASGAVPELIASGTALAAALQAGGYNS